jgi:hypothetical protein
MEKPKPAVAIISSTENQKGIEMHKKIAAHLQAAAKSHLKAAKYHEEGNHGKAAQSTITAYRHISLAQEAQKKDVGHHIING